MSERIDIDVVLHPQAKELIDSMNEAETIANRLSGDFGTMFNGITQNVQDIGSMSLDSMPIEFKEYYSQLLNVMKTQITQITQDLQKIDTKGLTQEVKTQLTQSIKNSFGMFSANLFDAKISSQIMRGFKDKFGSDMIQAFQTNFSDMLYSVTNRIGRSF